MPDKPKPTEDRDQPNPDWVNPKEGEVVGVFMRRLPNGELESGVYVIQNGRQTERLDR